MAGVRRILVMLSRRGLEFGEAGGQRGRAAACRQQAPAAIEGRYWSAALLIVTTAGGERVCTGAGLRLLRTCTSCAAKQPPVN